MADNGNVLFKPLLSLMGRLAFPEPRLAEIVNPPKGGGPKQIAAFNLCDGTRTQAEIAKELGLDQGNFRRTVQRWATAGVIFRLGDSREATLLHVYPLLADVAPAKNGKPRRAASDRRKRR
jgi:hypothetical protein